MSCFECLPRELKLRRQQFYARFSDLGETLGADRQNGQETEAAVEDREWSACGARSVSLATSVAAELSKALRSDSDQAELGSDGSGEFATQSSPVQPDFDAL